jgi:hypothetical protein
MSARWHDLCGLEYPYYALDREIGVIQREVFVFVE